MPTASVSVGEDSALAIDDDLLARLGRGCFHVVDEGSWGHGAVDTLMVEDVEAIDAQLTAAAMSPLGWLVPRPPIVVRVSALLAALLLGGLALLGAVAASAVGGLAEVVHERRAGASIALLEQPVPPAATLLDPLAFAALLAAEPERADEFHLGRARALSAVERWNEAADAWRQARLHSLNGFDIALDLAAAEAYLNALRPDAARALLEGYAMGRLPTAERGQVLRLLARCDRLDGAGGHLR